MEAHLLTTLTDRDHAVIWHPYTQAKETCGPLPIERGAGALLYDVDGRPYIDATSSWWVTLHGHTHPEITARIITQMHRLEHVMFNDFTHEPAVSCAETILSLLPHNFGRVFYSDNGSTAVETALKMTFQYWYNQGKQTKRKRVIAFRDGYHGDTIGAMSVSDRNRFIQPFWPYLFDVTLIDPPYAGQEEAALQQLQAELDKGDVACFIFEPVVQGVAGMTLHQKSGLDQLLQLCQQAEVLTIADEVMTGCGRTGPHFVSNTLSTPPDMICLAKSITGGFLPLGITATAPFIYDRFYSDSKADALLHGHSYCGNPLACTAALANLDLLVSDQCSVQRATIESHHCQFAHRCQGHPSLKRLEVTGTILGLEYVSNTHSYYDSLSRSLIAFFLDRGIIVRPFGNTLHVVPPYCTTTDQLEEVYQAIEASLELVS